MFCQILQDFKSVVLPNLKGIESIHALVVTKKHYIEKAFIFER